MLADPNTSGKGSLGVYGHGQDFGVYADAGGNGIGVVGKGGGVSGTGGGSNGPGVSGTGGSGHSGGPGVIGTGGNAGAGVIGAGSNGAPGVAGNSSGNGPGPACPAPASLPGPWGSWRGTPPGDRLPGRGAGRFQQKRHRNDHRREVVSHQDRGDADRLQPDPRHLAAKQLRCLGPVRGARRRGQLLHHAPEQGRDGQHHSGLLRGQLTEPREEPHGRPARHQNTPDAGRAMRAPGCPDTCQGK